ncbi:unnamed protein product [Heterobilharzia americana]|nr:unnamed protein product [Heterobilharzia americana]
MKSAKVSGLITVTCTVVGFSRGSVIGNATLTIEHDISSESFATTAAIGSTVRNAIVQYTTELVANGSDNVYFGTSNEITIEVDTEVTSEVTTVETETESAETVTEIKRETEITTVHTKVTSEVTTVETETESAETQTQMQTETERVTEMETETGTEAETVILTETQRQTHTQTQTQTEIQSVTETVTQRQTQAQTHTHTLSESTTGVMVKTVSLVISSPLTKSNQSVQWNDSLLDPSTALYQEYASELCDLLVNSMKSAKVSGLITVTCTVVGFSRGSVIGNATLTIEHDISSESFATTAAIGSTVRTAIVQYTIELVANGSDNVYFGTSNEITIEVTNENTRVTEPVVDSLTSITPSSSSRMELSIRIELLIGNRSVVWNPELTNNMSAVYNRTSQETCYLIKATAEYVTSIDFQISLCNIVRFYPGSIRAKATVIVDYMDSNNITQTQILQAMQLGARMYLINQMQGRSQDPSQITSILFILQPETCATYASKCSPHADCFETSDGTHCTCKAMWTDLNPQQPGEQCALSAAVIVLIVLVSVFVIVTFALATYFALNSERNGEQFMYSFV